MNAAMLGLLNAVTQTCVKDGTADPGDPERYPLFGFFDVNIFDCEPFVMFTANDDPRAINIVLGHDFEMGSMKLWCSLARKATAIIDIGAHTGVYSLAAASVRKKIQIHAFEPNPYAFARLRVNKQLNKFDNIAEHAYGLSGKSGISTLSWPLKTTPQISSGGAIVEQRPGMESVLVRVHRLDDLQIAMGERGLIKIDVEGYELAVFNGMPRIIEQRPDIILECFSQEMCSEIWARLPQGYRAFRILEKESELQPLPRLMAADKASVNYNQFLTTRPS